jgi:hypothetical protein
VTAPLTNLRKFPCSLQAFATFRRHVLSTFKAGNVRGWSWFHFQSLSLQARSRRRRNFREDDELPVVGERRKRTLGINAAILFAPKMTGWH